MKGARFSAGDLALMRLLQIVSPALPIGAFAYSQGLEQTVAEGWVTDEAEAAAWLLGLLESSFATLDLPVLARLDRRVARAGDVAAVERWSAWLAACRADARDSRRGSTARRRAGARARGAGDRRRRGLDAPACTSPTPRCSRSRRVRFEVPIEAALAGHAFAWAEAITSAAVRLVPLGQSAGQRLLAAAGAAIPAVVKRALALPDDEIGSAAPGQAIASARHETLYSRLFRS